ncbi:hypothetical protein BDR03DRAFT_970660 [Suillus americanus]|nr:hypothetical protein BDR03DRAFT_970660 [Suillus americanus]
MKGFLSLVLVSIALLQMTAAAPTVSKRSQATFCSKSVRASRMSRSATGA